METINETVKTKLSEQISQSISRLGINCIIFLDKMNETTYRIKSTPFQTFPVLFKEIKIEGYLRITPCENNEDLMAYVNLEYAYKLFEGGRNGHKLGRIEYVLEAYGTEGEYEIKENGLTL